MGKKEQKAASLSWFVVSTRHCVNEYDWFWDKRHHCCYGVPKEKMSENVFESLAEFYKSMEKPATYFEESVIMPELHELSIDEAVPYLIDWCNSNKIIFEEDLDRYKEVEAGYWGYDY